MAASSGSALRVALVRKGRVVEERVVAAGPVSVGSSAKATFAVPASDLPPSLVLFQGGKDGPALSLDGGLDGHVAGPDGQVALDALPAARARAEKGRTVVPLRLGEWGKVAVGEVTVLFEVVPPPKPAPKPALPPAAKGNRFRSLDGLFVAVLLGSLAVHVGAYLGLAATPVREEVTLEEIPDRFAKILIPERRPEPVVEEKKPEVVVEAKKEEEKPLEEKKPQEERTPEQKAQRAAAVAKAVQSKGLLKVLGSLGGGPGAGAATVAVFGGEEGGLGEVAQALSGVAAPVAADTALGGRRGAVAGTGAASIGELGGAGGKQVDLGAKTEVHVAGNVGAEAAEIDSADVDQVKLGSFVKARMPAIRACYETALKRNPALKGRIRIRFTILSTGALDEVDVAENTVGSPEVASCIVGTMRSWRTPFRPASAATGEFPFVFSPAN